MQEAGAATRPSKGRSWFLLAVLSIVYLYGSLDRIVISLLVDPIKADLGLTDTQVSLLIGMAFVLVYSAAGLIMGALVDRLSRSTLLAIGVAVWSLMTALCGMASTFWTLFFARAGVGIGEATLTPAGYSLISDAFERRRLGLALGIFTMGGAIGTGLSLILGGYAIGALSRYGDIRIAVLGTLHPWQLTFVLLALPGFVLALIVAALRGVPHHHLHTADGQPPRPAGAIAFYRANTAFMTRHHLATGLSSMALLGAYSWIAPFFARVYGWSPSEVGFTAGLVSIIGTPAGLLGGGALGDHLLDRGAQIRLLLCAASVACAAVFGVIYPLVASPVASVVLFGAMVMFATVPSGVGNAAMQHIVPHEVRGRVSAIYSFSVSMIGMLGPTLIAATSDHFFPFAGGIAYATAVVVPIALVLAVLFWLWAVPPYRALDMKAEAEVYADATRAISPVGRVEPLSEHGPVEAPDAGLERAG